MMNLPLKPYWELLAKYIRPQKRLFFLLTVLLFGSIGLQLINPQIMRGFIDAALAGAPTQQLVLSGLLFLGIAIFQQLLSVTVTYLGEKVAWTATNALRADLAWHCLTLDMDFHHQHTPGEMIERIDGDVAELASFFSQFFILLAGNLLLMLGILGALFREDWRVGLAFTIYAFVALFILSRVRDLAVPHQKARRQAEADLYGFLEEQLSSTEDIRSSGAISFSLRELYRYMTAILINARKAEFLNVKIGWLMAGLLLAGNLLAILSGYFLYQNGSITIGTVYLFIHYMNMIETPIWTLTHQVQSFQTIGACVERLVEFRKIGRTVLDGPGAVFPPGALPLRFDKVTFAYEKDEPVIQDLSFLVHPGKKMGLLGRTGSGKTTLARLIFRLYDPVQGSISLDGSDIRQAKLDSLRQHVSIVTQDVQLFRASIRDNLTFFNRETSDEKIMSAIDILGLSDWFLSLPQGLDTMLDSGAHSLSAGEAQLLAFTRVFLRNPGLVILDEASSRLDPATEQRIERAIDRLLDNRTAIIIAHRLGTVGCVDDIMILENGTVCEYGSREALACDHQSRFYQLLQTGLEEVLA
jgi:ATP-binding cassette, subfamily B, bacterial